MTKPIILDVDTGSDDAIAIIVAELSDDLDLKFLTTVNGNKAIEYTTENTLRVVELLKKDIKVYKGCGLPMVSTLEEGRRDEIPFKAEKNVEVNVHDDYLLLPEASKKAEIEHSVFKLVNYIMKLEEKITLIFVGPLTNLAMAMRIEPQILDNIEEIIIMGGGVYRGNRTLTAEFNFWVDPEAAQCVINSGANITIVPLEATHKALVSTLDIENIKSINTEISEFVAKTIKQRLDGYNAWQPMEDETTVPIHDVLAVMVAIDSSIVTQTISCYAQVDCNTGLNDGKLVADVNKLTNKNHNVKIVMDIDSKKFTKQLIEILSKSKCVL